MGTEGVRHEGADLRNKASVDDASTDTPSGSDDEQAEGASDASSGTDAGKVTGERTKQTVPGVVMKLKLMDILAPICTRCVAPPGLVRTEGHASALRYNEFHAGCGSIQKVCAEALDMVMRACAAASEKTQHSEAAGNALQGKHTNAGIGNAQRTGVPTPALSSGGRRHAHKACADALSKVLMACAEALGSTAGG